jgi:hypothetical protein
VLIEMVNEVLRDSHVSPSPYLFSTKKKMIIIIIEKYFDPKSKRQT